MAEQEQPEQPEQGQEQPQEIRVITSTRHEVFEVDVVELAPPQTPVEITILRLVNPITMHSDDFVMSRAAAKQLGEQLRGPLVQTHSVAEMRQAQARSESPIFRS